MRSRNYKDTMLFEWLRESVFKIDKPSALPWGAWERWDRDLKSSRPVAFFLTETLPEWLEKPGEWVVDPFYNFAYYLRNRFMRGTHLVHTDLKPGDWHEYETRILHGMFTELVDFVEIEQAWHHAMWNEDVRKKYHTPWWRNNWLFYWREWRCPEAGIEYFKWCMTLDDPSLPSQDQNHSQAEVGREVLTLYSWWKDIRPQRQDPYDEVGLTEFSQQMDKKYGRRSFDPSDKNLTAQERRKQSQLYDAVHKLEEDRHREDEEMMIRLIKIRRGLWT